MRILWLGRSVDLTQDAGDRIYSFNLASAVAEHPDVHLTYVGLTDVPEKGFTAPAGAVEWRPVHARMRSALCFFNSALPMSGARNDVHDYREAVRRALSGEHWDAVVLDHYALVLALPLIEVSGWQGPIVHVAQDFETHVTRDIATNFRGNPVKKVLLWLNAQRTATAERELAARSALVAAPTRKDVDSFLRLNPRLVGLVMPPGYAGPVAQVRTIDAALPKRVVAIGSFGWIAKRMNLIEFVTQADEVFFQRGIEFRVIGKIPVDFHEVRNRAWKATRFLGFVDDPTTEFAKARIGLVFDRTGGGFKLKMLDYIFQRLPIAGYSNALEGLPASVLAHVVSATDTDQLLDAITTMIERPDVLQEMQTGAFEAARGLFDWRANGNAFVASLEKLRGIHSAL